MIQLTNTGEQTLQPGQSATFDTVVLKTGCSETHRLNSGLVRVKGGGCYEVSFSANITGTAAGPVQLSIELDGEPMPETTIINSIGTAGYLENVATSTIFRTCCGCCARLSVANTGTSVVTVGAGPSLSVKRVA